VRVVKVEQALVGKERKEKIVLLDQIQLDLNKSA